MGKPVYQMDLKVFESSKASYEKTLGRPLTQDESHNLYYYGAVSSQEYAAPDDELKPGQCVCGAFECGEEYAHHTSGW